MNEVMLLGILVALIKIAELATVVPGIGMYAMGALVILFAAIMIAVDPREIWNRVTWEADVPAGLEPAPRPLRKQDDDVCPHGRPGGTPVVRDVRAALAARGP